MSEHEIDSSRAGAELDLVYWPVGSALINTPFGDQLRIAQAGGFTSLAVSPATFRALRAAGHTANDILGMAAERGLRLSQLDGLARWVDNWHPAADTEGNRMLRNAFDVSMEEALDIAAALRMQSLVAVGFFDEGSIPLDELVLSFGRLCDAASMRGLRVDLEFIPLWGVRELPLAWQIVEAANRPNSGLCVDTWHLQMGSTDYERDLALLGTIPGSYLRTVQLADAYLNSSKNLLALGEVTRRFAGEGELDVARILSLIEAKGELSSVGPEVMGGRLTALSPEEIGVVAGRTTRSALEAARIANREEA